MLTITVGGASSINAHLKRRLSLRHTPRGSRIHVCTQIEQGTGTLKVATTGSRMQRCDTIDPSWYFHKVRRQVGIARKDAALDNIRSVPVCRNYDEDSNGVDYATSLQRGNPSCVALDARLSGEHFISAEQR